MEFPSISFCRTFKHPTPGFLDLIDDSSENSIKSWALNNTFHVEELFTFVNHAGEETGFECNSIDGPLLKGQPCVFPFIWGDCSLIHPSSHDHSFYCTSFDQVDPVEVYHACTTKYDVRPWCATRVFKNQSMVPYHYGYCAPGCNGSLPKFENSKNLANLLFRHLWKESIFHLDPWKAGHCHTYTPKNQYTIGELGSFYAYLGNDMEKGETVLNRRATDIYLHSSKVFGK